jgi:hypothetical protein
MVSAELEPVTRTFGTTVVKDDALAAYATNATQNKTTDSVGLVLRVASVTQEQ